MKNGTEKKRNTSNYYDGTILKCAIYFLLWTVAVTEATITLKGSGSTGSRGGYSNSHSATAAASRTPRIVTIKRSRALGWHGVGTPPPPPLNVPRPPVTPPWRFMPGAAPAARLWPHVLRALQLSRNRGDTRRWQTPPGGRGTNYGQSTRIRSRIDQRPTTQSGPQSAVSASTTTATTTGKLTNNTQSGTTSRYPIAGQSSRTTSPSAVQITAIDQPTLAYNQLLQRRHPSPEFHRQHQNHLLARQGRFGAKLNNRLPSEYRKTNAQQRVHQPPEQPISNRNWRRQKKKSFMSNFISRIFGGAPKTIRKKQPYTSSKIGAIKNNGYKMYQSRPLYQQTPSPAYGKRSNTYEEMNPGPNRNKNTINYGHQQTTKKLEEDKKMSNGHKEKTIKSKTKLDPSREKSEGSDDLPLEFELEDARDWESKRIKLDDITKSFEKETTANQQAKSKTLPAKFSRLVNDHTEEFRPIHTAKVVESRASSQQHQEPFRTRKKHYGDSVWPGQTIKQKSDGTLVVTGTLLEPTDTTSTKRRSQSRSQRGQLPRLPNITPKARATDRQLSVSDHQPLVVSAMSDYNVFNNHLLLKRRHLETAEPQPVVANSWQPAQHLAITLHQLIAQSRDQKRAR